MRLVQALCGRADEKVQDAKTPRPSIEQLEPDWEQQVYRITCPCKDAHCGYEWARYGPAFTLGELFLALGKEYTARQIYAFYLSLRLIAVKRRKTQSTGRGAGAATGVTGSPFQAANMRSELKYNRTQLIEEYAAVHNLDPLPDNKESLDAATRYLYKLLLSDLRPPWLTEAFPQALPGNSLLSRYSRPCFLQWGDGEGADLFGDSVATRISQHVDSLGLELRGFLARPLYVCTASSGRNGEMCMSLASMSQLVKHAEGRREYRCRKCAKKASEREPASGSGPLRVLHIYALVSTSGPASTPLHMPAVRLVVTAPPEDWAWCRSPEDWSVYNGGARSTAWPTQGVDSRGAHFRYNDAESRVIWHRSRCYGAHPSAELD